MKIVFEYCIEIHEEDKILPAIKVLAMAEKKFFRNWFKENIIEDEKKVLNIGLVKDHFPQYGHARIFNELTGFLLSSDLKFTKDKSNRVNVWYGLKIKSNTLA